MPVKIPVLDLYWHWLRCKSLPVVARFGYVKADQPQLNKTQTSKQIQVYPSTHCSEQTCIFNGELCYNLNY